MNAPLIGMAFPSFLVLLILSAIAATVIHWGVRYQLFKGIDGFMGPSTASILVWSTNNYAALSVLRCS
jgi:hypothetical protein